MTRAVETSARTARRLATCALVVALALPSVAVARESASSLEDFGTRVRSAYELASGSTTRVETSAEAADVAEQIAELLPGNEIVEVDGVRISVDESVARALAAKLAAAETPRARRQAIEALAAHLASLANVVGESGNPIREDAEALETLLTGQEARTDWFQETLRRVLEWFASLLEGLSIEPSEGGELIVKVVLWVLGVGLGIVVAWLVLRAIRARRERDLGSAGAEDAGAPVVTAAEGLPDDPRSYAGRLADEGRFREAVRALFGGAARELVRHGLVRQTRTLTNRELLRAVRLASTAAHAPLGTLAADFEVAWYGHVDPGRGGFDRAAALYDDVLGAARSFGPAAGGEAA